jgi:hypothetical protein|tara:strand:+ start:505 stop:1107 length:603 start_codon:yes stop_codon:yes gene_type:complete
MSIVTLNNRALKDATAVGTTTGLGDLVFISRSTASSSSSVNITSGIDSTYKEYIFIFNNIHPATDGTHFNFQATTNGSDFNVTTTSTTFEAYNNETSGSTSLYYDSNKDHAQDTGYINLVDNIGSDNDQSVSGFLHLFDPSNTTFVKHFLFTSQRSSSNDFSANDFTSGYFNTTTAITGLSFKYESGNIDSGTIDLYGVN